MGLMDLLEFLFHSFALFYGESVSEKLIDLVPPIIWWKNLKKVKDDMYNEENLEYLGFFTKGYRKRVIHWEMTKQVFKVVLLFLNVFLSGASIIDDSFYLRVFFLSFILGCRWYGSLCLYD
jgi:hypothetical protein